MGTIHKDTLQLIEMIYAAIDEGGRWDLFLEHLASSFGTYSARLRMVDRRNERHNLLASAGYDESFDKDYVEHYVKLDPWNPLMEKAGTGVMSNSHEAITDKAMRGNQCYNEFYKKFDMFYGLGGHVVKMDHFVARIGVQRSYKAGPFNDTHKHTLQLLVPHLQRALRLGMHLEDVRSERNAMQDVLYHLPTPIVLIDEFGKVAFINRRAESIVENSKILTIKQNRIFSPDESLRISIKYAIQQAMAVSLGHSIHSPGGVRMFDYHCNEYINFIVTPYPQRSSVGLGFNSKICVAIFIQKSGEISDFPVNLLKMLYGLSTAEIRLAKGLMDGLTPSELAACFGVKITTVRTQLRSLFSKTGASGQVELVRLLADLMSRI